jgi:cyclic di-GMP phosphodiesterase
MSRETRSSSYDAEANAQAQAQLQLYAQDLRKLLDAERAKAGQLAAAHRQLLIYARELKQTVAKEHERALALERAYLDTVQRLNRAVSLKDNETACHDVRIGHYAELLAIRSGWTEADAERLFRAAPLHDVGKIGVPDSILRKPGPLDDYEWERLRQHTHIGAELLAGSGSQLLDLAREIALSHHENFDGSGYPQGLAGGAIPESAAIVHVVDVYDALRSERPYKRGLDHAAATRVILEGDGRTMPCHFHPHLLLLFQRSHTELEKVYERVNE